MTTPALRLYQLPSEYESIIERIEEAGGECEMGSPLALELAAIEDTFEVKVERLALHIRNELASTQAEEAEAMRFQDRAAVRKRRVEWLKRYLMQNMQAMGTRKVERPLATVSIVQNGGALPVEWNGEPEAIPAIYRVTKLVYSLDRAKVLEDHAAKVTLPVGLTVKDRGQRLAIK